jgi:hypothetical protein
MFFYLLFKVLHAGNLKSSVNSRLLISPESPQKHISRPFDDSLQKCVQILVSHKHISGIS